jgi:uncharacterized membrane protein YqjE
VTDYDKDSMATDRDAQTPAAQGEAASLGDTIQRFVGASKEAVSAELSLVQVRASLIGSTAKWIAILAVIAVITAFGMIMTLMIGAVLALAPLWGLGLAVLMVTGAAFLAILLCAFGIRAQIIRLKGLVR